jgi:eukaryotic-like serine/threonine-protein kinase
VTADVGRLTSALADRYRIERELGQGGMATVYLAQDVRHDRRVALKVLKPELAAVLGADRFVVEIKTTAALQHPHILPLFDSGTADGFLYYVMPFVDGETLRNKLDRETQLGVDEAVRIATDVADALHYAHQHGVIHRDIKPENVLLANGRPVVADFGIALAVSAAAGGRMTETGLSLGTPHYMSPEQATADKEISARSDVYSLASVLYEMLAGQPPHLGGSAQQIIMKIIAEQPAAVTTLRKSVPPNVAAAVMKALEKLPADRFDSARAFATALGDPHFGEEHARATLAAAGGARSWLRDPRSLAALTGVVVLGAFSLSLWGDRSPATTMAAPVRFELTPTTDAPLDQAAGVPITISADGRVIVYVAVTAGTRALVSRRIDELDGRIIPGTQRATAPALSPDGRWVAFIRTGKISKVPVDGGAVIDVAENATLDYTGRLAWLSEDEIIFAARQAGKVGLWRVPAIGGPVTSFKSVDSTEGHEQLGYPVADFEHGLVFYESNVATRRRGSRIGVARIADGRSTLLNLNGVNPLGVAVGHLIYLSPDGTLLAAPFDASAIRVTGDPIPLFRLGRNDATALSASGTLVYARGTSEGQLVMVDDRGSARPFIPTGGQIAHPRFSPDGKRLAVDIAAESGQDIWTYDVASGTPTRLTTSGQADRPEWNADGSRVIYLARPDPATLIERVWSQPADGSGAAEEIFRRPIPVREAILADQGRTLIFRDNSPTSQSDIRFVSLPPRGEPQALVATGADELMPRLSPDGRWLAYQSNESGRYEIYVRAFPTGGSRTTVSNAGGAEPLWSRDGKRLFYRNGMEMVATSVAASGALDLTSRQVLFRGRFDLHAFHPNYDVTPDGRHFVMVSSEASETRIAVVTNWFSELRDRFGARKGGKAE